MEIYTFVILNGTKCSEESHLDSSLTLRMTAPLALGDGFRLAKSRPAGGCSLEGACGRTCHSQCAHWLRNDTEVYTFVILNGTECSEESHLDSSRLRRSE